ncbi:hypothetical protein DCAR_0520867 [Daucus carota subsp. sativus]|uniref:Exocyst subunit Exo70 family protein n=1 Tax=Daucus carota subsp. sativus TaxID=79200 RepID=A0A164YVD2_DAUCS|nr:PREDICTED: exocyst complex component EXO70B1-like [Daucus carota subsp. sativus]XP_017253584.1 PREDICTED: exocyst complex component EXO70B1-like [Daucus carota subsp. sativus]WOH01483.1 hypothetical protein DCAR_0520867 [Daucus carota subsp. sativus]
MAENGEEKLIAVARHIAKTLGHTDNTADDILQIFSNFDGRLREKLSEKLIDDDDVLKNSSLSSLDQNLKSLDRRISRYLSADRLIWSDSADSAAFLDAVDDLIAVIRDWTPMAAEKSVASSLDRAEDLLQQSMFRLEDEFKSLMERGGESFDVTRYSNGESTGFDSDEEIDDDENDDDEEIPVAHRISDFNIVIDALPSGTINDLHEIAKRMVIAGYGKECSYAYSSYRREFLDESVSRLGLQKLSTDEVQKMQWADLEEEIERWIKAANVAVRILFPSERRLCDRVFYGFSNASDLSYMEVCRGGMTQLLQFADAVAIGSRAPERLYKVLDVFEALRDLIPHIQMVFADQYCLFMCNEAISIWKKLGEAIRGIFMELENLIRRDPAKAAVPGGGLHPITRYVMNYIRVACQSRQTLEQVFEDGVSSPVDRPSSSSSLSVQMSWMMELLESNLEAKSKIYRDTALASVFMMNNGRYIVQKVKDSELGSLLGDDWTRKHTAKVKQYHVNYQRSSWSKVLQVLKLDNNSSSPTVELRAMKEKIKLFNNQFDEICKIQSNWVIFDEQLKQELRISVFSNLSMAYRSFLGRVQSVPDTGRQMERHIKYTVEDLESKINELFRGNGRRK